MYPGDAYRKIPTALFTDRRVTSYWDPTEVSGRWFGREKLGGLEGIVWDAVYAFSPGASWGSGKPTHLVTSGSPVIGVTGGLSSRFLPLLRG
jgi:hypothetical protein